MQIELNFEAASQTQAFFAIDVMLPMGVVFESRVQQNSYDGPDGKVNTNTCIVRFLESVQLAQAIGIAYQLADFLDEDCVAVRNGDAGLLVGPNAAKWGDFNPDFFIRF